MRQLCCGPKLSKIYLITTVAAARKQGFGPYSRQTEKRAHEGASQVYLTKKGGKKEGRKTVLKLTFPDS